MQREISFYDEGLKKQISGSYTVERGIITAHSADGVKSARVGASAANPEHVVRMMLRELAVTAAKQLK